MGTNNGKFYDKLDIKGILDEVSQKGNFYCEKRLVFEFAKILEKKEFQIFLEYPNKIKDNKTGYNKIEYEDIRAETQLGATFVFEFKYCPSDILVKHGNMVQSTRQKSPLKKRKEDFERDIARTHKTVETKEVDGGFCIFITNQPNIIAELEKEKYKYKIENFNKMKAFIVCV